jgi:bifunctional DNA primase/polymerase-like protein
MEPLSEELRTKIRNQALAYHERGLTIIPIDTSEGKKKPPRRFRWWKYQRQRPTDAEISKWFGPKSNFNGVAVILGRASGGLACRDFDDAAAYVDWANAHPDLAKSLPTVTTGRGFHVYFRSEKEGFNKFPDGEYRADCKHYCILPPSRHPNGSFYTWTAPLQDELRIIDPHQAGLCSPSSSSDTQRTHDTQDTHYTQETPPPASPPSCPESPVSSVSAVSAESFGAEVEERISQTLPSGEGQRNRCLFEFARLLQGLARYAEANPCSLKPIVREWHRRALPFILTKPFDTTWFEFLNAWPQIKYPTGTGPLDQALRRASEQPLPPAALEYEDPKVRLLVALVAELQRMAGEKPFFLDCRSAGRLIGVGHTQANLFLRGLVADGVLELGQKGGWETKKASEYRYLPDLN